MTEYIEREAVKGHLRSYAGMFTDELGFAVSLEAVLNGIDFQPAADVVSRAAFDQVMWERDTAMEQLKEHGIPFGGKADVVAVVRCKDCVWWDNDSDLPWCVNKFVGLVCSRPNDFCSYGEKRGAGGE